MINDWKDFFDAVKGKEYSKKLHSFLDEEYSHHIVYPPRDLVYNAFKLTSPKDLKVIIIGQDPYHNVGQAMGLSFSVPKGIPLPPSLINIYKEIEGDMGVKMDYSNGDLTPWARQGVLLLNAYLTVRENEPLSHRNDEYDSFIADTMRYIDAMDQPMVFLLWGSFAKKFASFVKNSKHIVLSSVHPSPLSANRGGWFGKHNFSECNKFLLENAKTPIDWKI
ncbi:MAG: uracil-DNA glycosylase [Bacilli bacterium]|nr:uracil-DNA glycosylase [Bacilli bacterium]